MEIHYLSEEANPPGVDAAAPAALLALYDHEDNCPLNVFNSLALVGGNLLSKVAWPLNGLDRDTFAKLLACRMLEVADAEEEHQAAGHG